MQATVLRQLLVTEWARVENTPLGERQPAKEQLWHGSARQLAECERRPVVEVVAELKAGAREVATRWREETVADLARDLAVFRALGQQVAMPWRRRLDRLAGAAGVPVETVLGQVESRAAAVLVEVRL